MSSRLSDERWAQVVRDAPLISFDLVVWHNGKVLLGWRTNQPARHCWFVPGGVVRKGETLSAAFARVSKTELGKKLAIEDSQLLGVHEHFYDTNFSGDARFGTHYVVIVRSMTVALLPQLPQEQHSRYCWLSQAALLAHPDVHVHVKRYFA